MNNVDLTKPMRQSPLGIVMFAIVATRKLARAIWPLILIYAVKNNSLPDQVKFYIYLALGFIILLVITHGILTYFYFYFYIENNEFIVNKGYLKKVKLAIPLERIQTINIKQNIVQQILKLVSLEIDTAGSSGKELNIIALKKPFAEKIQEYLTIHKSANKTTDEQEGNEVIEEEVKTILRLDVGDLIKVGITENHLRSALILVALSYGFIQQFESIFKERMESASEQAETILINSGTAFYIYLALAILFIGFVFSILRTIVVHFNLNLKRKGKKFFIISGLLNKKNLTIPYSKIQVLSWRTNPLRKALDFVTVEITQAASNEKNKKQAIIIPGCNTQHKTSIITEVFDNNDDAIWSIHKIHPIFFFRLWLIRGLVPALLSIAIWYPYNVVYYIAAAWAVFAIFMSYLSFRKYYFRISKELIEKSSGTFGQKNMRMFNFKVQNVKYRQTFFQRRRNLATIRIYTAGGKQLSIPYIDNLLAKELYDYLLMSVEADNRKWM